MPVAIETPDQPDVRALIDALDSYQASSCYRLMLETGVRQPEAIALHRRFGYAHCGPFNGYRDDPLSLFMEKELRD